jgi:RHS repeat-associated protein
MLYPNGYMNINQNGEYTKHYYAGDQRIASKIGTGFVLKDGIYLCDKVYKMPNISFNYFVDRKFVQERIMIDELGATPYPNETVQIISPPYYGDFCYLHMGYSSYEQELYFYRGDHLNSTQAVSDIHGSLVQSVFYAPFGEVIYEDNAYWKLDTIPRYLFNAKELDEENGMYYYSARYYNPPTFISRDPLFEKYPFMSPYAYCYNNPLKFIDPTGKEGVVVVNEKTQTLTVIATYFVMTKPSSDIRTYTSDEITSMQNNINNILNSAGYTVTDGQYAGYAVQFDLQFKEGGDPANMITQAENEKYGNIPIGNTFEKGNQQTHKKIFTPQLNGDVTGGVTHDNKRILMNELYDNNRNQIHEIFHTLFFNQDGASNGIGSYTKSDMPNQNDINILINNTTLQKVKKP